VRLAIAAVCLAVGACLPLRHSLEGRPCDDEHACGGSLTCLEGICVVAPLAPEDGGPSDGGDGGLDGDAGIPEQVDNLLPNGGFESGPQGSMFQWTGGGPGGIDFVVQPDVRRTGSYAGRLTNQGTSSGTGSLSTRPFQISPLQEGLHCVDAWVQGTGLLEKVELLIERNNAIGGPTQAPATPGSSVDAPANQWTRIRHESQVGSGDIDFILRFRATLPEQADLFVDDVRVWRSTTGACP
jgi:hypothetical protein